MPAAVTDSARMRALVGSSAVVTVAVIAANALNAVFQLALARILSPGEYSLLAALVVVTLVAAVPPVAFQTAVAREVALRLSDGRADEAGAALRAMLVASLYWSAGTLALAGIAYPVLVALDGTAAPAMLATAATIAAALPIPIITGALQGTHQFAALSWTQLLFAGSRLAAGAGVGLAGGDAAAVMAAVALATLVTVLLSLVPLRNLLAAARAAARARRRLATLPNAAAAVGLTALTALAMIDLLVARIAFDGDTAGAYAAASVAARILLLLPIGVVTVLFPRVATLRDPVRERRYLLAGIASVAVAGAVATAVLWTLADPLVDLAFGADYRRAAEWLGPLSLAMALYGVANVYVYHFLSLGRTRYALVLVALFVCQIIAFAAAHGRPGEVVAVQIATGAATLLSAEAWYAWAARADRRVRRRP